jgi:hypothetical protein|tara:strand:+ start:254 stop:433 length:180 start_codon:yes stop_codon:yes gene_type:complete
MSKGTNEYVDEEDGRPYQKPEVDVDAINDEIWLRKKEEEEKEKGMYIWLRKKEEFKKNE